MTDPRLTPANDRVISQGLDLPPEGRSIMAGQPARLGVAVADLCRAPDGPRDRQLLRGAAVRLFETRGGWSFVQADFDGYVGYVREAALSHHLPAPTHRVISRATHAYSRPDFKSAERSWLSFGTHLAVTGETGSYAETDAGFVPARHLAPLEAAAGDPVAIAETLMDTPYLWGGNSSAGIDCSGLVQIALGACGRTCPGDSDLQEAAFEPARANAPPQRGDLLFWKGHVAWVAAPDLLIHASAHHMAVARENLDAAVTRIAEQGDGPVILHARPR